MLTGSLSGFAPEADCYAFDWIFGLLAGDLACGGQAGRCSPLTWVRSIIGPRTRVERITSVRHNSLDYAGLGGECWIPVPLPPPPTHEADFLRQTRTPLKALCGGHFRGDLWTCAKRSSPQSFSKTEPRNHG
jgi:hypothetical protein